MTVFSFLACNLEHGFCEGQDRLLRQFESFMFLLVGLREIASATRCLLWFAEMVVFRSSLAESGALAGKKSMRRLEEIENAAGRPGR
jgi:hypothetical protein